MSDYNTILRRDKMIAQRIREIMKEGYKPKQAVPMAFKDLNIKVADSTINNIIKAFEEEQERMNQMSNLIMKADDMSDKEFADMYKKTDLN